MKIFLDRNNTAVLDNIAPAIIATHDINPDNKKEVTAEIRAPINIYNRRCHSKPELLRTFSIVNDSS